MIELTPPQRFAFSVLFIGSMAIGVVLMLYGVFLVKTGDNTSGFWWLSTGLDVVLFTIAAFLICCLIDLFMRLIPRKNRNLDH